MARSTLRELFPSNIMLTPDDSGRFLWATFAFDDYATTLSLLYDTTEERLDANAAALAAFSQTAEALGRVDGLVAGPRFGSYLHGYRVGSHRLANRASQQPTHSASAVGVDSG